MRRRRPVIRNGNSETMFLSTTLIAATIFAQFCFPHNHLPDFNFSPLFLRHDTIFPIEFDLEKLAVTQNNFVNCPQCNIPNIDKSHITSTPRDLVVAVIMNIVDNIFPFVRSLRTTGCNATIVILADDVAYSKLSEDTFFLFRLCNIHVFNIGELMKTKKRISIFAVKHMIAYDFIYKSAGLFDRVLLTDLCDVVFQSDPFWEEIEAQKLTVIKEARQFKNDVHNSKRVNKIWTIPEIIADQHPINGGIMYGSPEVLMKYEDLYFSQFDIHDIDNTHKTCDQGYINYLYYSGAMTRENISTNLWEQEHGFESLASVSEYPTEKIGNIYFTNVRGVIIHMFDRTTRLVNNVLEACPQGTFKVYENSYTRLSNQYKGNKKIFGFIPTKS